MRGPVRRVSDLINSRARRWKRKLRARIEPVRRLEHLNCRFGDIVHLGVRLTNTGTDTWYSRRPDNPDLLSYHWKSTRGADIDYDGLRTPLPCPVRSGQSVVLPMRISVTARVPQAVLVVDMLREGEAWFGERGRGALRLPCSITGLDAAPISAHAGRPGSSDGYGETWAPTVEGFWGLRAGVRDGGGEWGWLDHPAVLEDIVYPRIKGEERNWLLELMRKHGVSTGGRWLSVGCGDGSLELWLMERGIADSIVGIDVSPHAVEVARGAAAHRHQVRAEFKVVDLNNQDLPEDSYDAIVASMSLHHIEDLERAFGNIYGALKTGGYFLANEYVGPSRFQFPACQKGLAEVLISLLPREYRFHPVASEERGSVVYKDNYLARTPEQWEAVDPSEAVRSASILDVFRGVFSERWVYHYGGSLLHLVLEHIAGNFDPGQEKDRAVIKMMGLLEDALIERGRLSSDFALMAGKRTG